VNERPKEDEQRTWHEHDDGTWEWETICLACSSVKRYPLDLKQTYFNIKRLQEDNAGGYTQRMIEKEIFESAREDGREIEKA